jgi:excinuclease ABC subunit C
LEEADAAELVESVLLQMYGDDAVDADIPREVLVPALPDDVDALVEFLCRRRGTRVDLRIPQRGDKKSLFDTVQRNAEQALVRHKVRRASDLTARSLALQELQESLGLAESPLRIECFDVSTLQGTETVASMVVFEDGLPRKSEYRRFAVKGDATDDLSSLHEVIRRRFLRYLDERQALGAVDLPGASPPGEMPDSGTPGDGAGLPDAVTGRPRRFAYPPNLLVVDGGAPQVAAAQQALDELGIDDVALCGLAKRLEEVWMPGRAEPLILPRSSEALYLLQRVRDEAHRFAITYHRARRSKSMTSSALDSVPGLGETRRKALLKRFGSVRRLREATVAEIAEVPGIGPRTAAAIASALTGGPGDAVAVDPATGEILRSAKGE